MITLTLEAVLGVMLAVVIMQFFKKHPQPVAASATFTASAGFDDVS